MAQNPGQRLPLTEKQQRAFDIIKKFVAEHAFPPTSSELAVELGTTNTSARQLILALQAKGYLKRERYGCRTIQVVE